jgi:O-acetylhomoserine/O-acetylserine sulfhydrylase-like pyridoxal-dependent enzyme
MGRYASILDVAAVDAARATYTATSRPNASQVAQLITMVEGEVDTLLVSSGWELPVPTGATIPLDFLRSVTSKGAVAMIESSSPVSDRRSDARAMWLEAREMIRRADFPGMSKDSDALARWAPKSASPLLSIGMNL